MGRSARLSGVRPLTVVGAVLLAGAPLASTLGHRCPPLAVPVGRLAPLPRGPGTRRTGRARRRRTHQADSASLSRGGPATRTAGERRAGDAGGDIGVTAGNRERAG